jgi:hypothetical protein
MIVRFWICFQRIETNDSFDFEIFWQKSKPNNSLKTQTTALNTGMMNYEP